MKKKLMIVLLSVAASTFFISCNEKPIPPSVSETVNGKLGDVKYSTLTPEQFVKENGKGWVLMDGRNINNTDLFKLSSLTIIPDARGVFIRGMNENRDASTGDTETGRAMGSYQRDEIISHVHEYSTNKSGDSNSGSGKDAAKKDFIPANTKPIGGAETRPRNIALYTYIKVNR